ncbi:MAG: hypothetical protein ACYST6_17705 [Planctomycetota bacterium]|jgi:hypothetical protein
MEKMKKSESLLDCRVGNGVADPMGVKKWCDASRATTRRLGASTEWRIVL